MDGITNYSIDRIKAAVVEQPFPYVVLPDFFTDLFYANICNQFESRLEANQFHGLGAYDATGHVIEEGTSVGNLFYSRKWLAYASNIFDLNLNGKTDASFHHHAIGSKSGWVHNDLHTVYIKDERNADGVAVWRQNTDYWNGSCGTKGSKRRLTFMCFLNNEWTDGDNGELGFYNNAEQSSLFLKIPPINNSALFFKCCENSWHAYIGDNKHERNSAIQFFLTDED